MAGKWVTLSNIAVDPVTHTISGNTSHFTAFAALTPAPTPTLALVPAAPANWSVIGGLIALVIVIIGLLVYFLWWRRRSA